MTEVSLADSTFFCRIQNLAPNRNYIARSFVKYNNQIIYGVEIEFTTNTFLKSSFPTCTLASSKEAGLMSLYISL